MLCGLFDYFLNRFQPGLKQKQFHVNLFVMMGKCLLVKGCKLLQVKLFSFCK